MFNVATIVHGYEALLAIGFIFTIHFFNAHLRLEKFPVDDVIFTGRLPEEEFKHERGAEYERLVASGELEALRVPPAAAVVPHVRGGRGHRGDGDRHDAGGADHPGGAGRDVGDGDGGT